MRIDRAALLATFIACGSSACLASDVAKSFVGKIQEAPRAQQSIGKSIEFAGLQQAEANVVWQDGVSAKMTKIFESPSLIILQTVGVIGSTDTVYLDLRHKRFVVLSVGAMTVPTPSGSILVSEYRGSLE